MDNKSISAHNKGRADTFKLTCIEKLLGWNSRFRILPIQTKRGVSIYRRFSSFLYLNKFVLLRNWQLRLDLSRINLGSVQYYNARLLSFFHGSCKMKLQILTFGEYWNRFLKYFVDFRIKIKILKRRI